jgi:hypothetical protein
MLITLPIKISRVFQSLIHAAKIDGFMTKADFSSVIYEWAKSKYTS